MSISTPSESQSKSDNRTMRVESPPQTSDIMLIYPWRNGSMNHEVINPKRTSVRCHAMRTTHLKSRWVGHATNLIGPPRGPKRPEIWTLNCQIPLVSNMRKPTPNLWLSTKQFLLVKVPSPKMQRQDNSQPGKEMEAGGYA